MNRALLFFSLLTCLQGFAQDQSKDSFEKTGLFKKYYQSLTKHRDARNFDSAIYYNNKLIESSQPESRKVKMIFQKIDTYLAFNRTAEAYKLGILTKEKYCKSNTNNCEECSLILRRLARIMEMMEDYEEAVKFLEEDCNTNRSGSWYFDKAMLQVKLGDTDGALTTALEHIDLTSDKSEKVGAYNKYGIVARETEKYSIAIESFKSALEIIDQFNIRKNLKPIILGNIGSCYLAQGDYDQAYTYILADAQGSLEKNETGSYINAELTLATIEQHWNQHNKAIQRLEELWQNYETKLSNAKKTELFQNLIVSMNATGNTSGYKKYSEKYIQLVKEESEMGLETNRELIKAHSQNSVSLVKDQMTAERNLMDKEVQLLEEEQERKSQRNWFIISGLALLLIIVGLLFGKYRSDQKKKQQMKQVQLDLAKKEQEILSLKVQEESRSVQELSLELTVKNDFAQSLSKELLKLDGLDSADRRHIEMFVQSEMDIKSTRAELQEEIGEIGSNFYRDLKIKHPNLSDTETRLAVMIVLNLSNKEIAIKKNITPDSAKIAKTRLKKKLGLSKEDDMHTYLKKIVHEA